MTSKNLCKRGFVPSELSPDPQICPMCSYTTAFQNGASENTPTPSQKSVCFDRKSNHSAIGSHRRDVKPTWNVLLRAHGTAGVRELIM